MGREHKTRAFTLIELLAVIAIILLLVSLLAPTLRFAQARARTITCKNNLHQLYLGMVGDLQNRGQPGFRGYQNGKLWMDDVELNLGRNESVRFCPEALEKSPYSFASNCRQYWTFYDNKGTYGLNGWLYNPYGGSAGANGGAAYYFGNADWPDGFWGNIGVAGARVPMFADCNWVDAWPFWDDAVPKDLNVGIISAERPSYMGRFCIARHVNNTRLGINIVFCDGHADYVDLNALWDLQWSQKFKRQGIKSPFP